MRIPIKPILAGAILAGCPAMAYAGMPSYNLTDVARMRLQSISFFFLLFLLVAGCIQLLWNYLRRDFAVLPRLSYGKALGVAGLWGLLFVLVLTMISGARELMTPGAWEKQGATYRLASGTPPSGEKEQEWTRREKLVELRAALWQYARTHDGCFPDLRAVAEIATEKWQVPDPSGMRYVYRTGQQADQGARPLAYEPEIFGRWRMVLCTDGQIRQMDSDELLRALK